ncbi:MAG: cytochrome c biogenesis protein ResB [Vampirovibrionales bacterium]|nr:cytochrome c biogenesis protein ResB [Vampirovibrionales bacterium]
MKHSPDLKDHRLSVPLLKQLWRLLQSVQLAVTLLITLALATLMGVLLPQEGLVELAQIKQQFGAHYLWIRALGAFNVFSAPWFIALQVLFFINLIFGSVVWLRPAVRSVMVPIFCSARHIALTSGQRPVLKSAQSLDSTVEKTIALLKQNGFRVRQNPKNEQELYASKGDLGRLGPVVAHIGIAMLLTGSLLAALTGFKAQHLLSPGESVMLPQAERVLKNAPDAIWLAQVPNLKVAVERFEVVFHKALSPMQAPVAKQYYCQLAVFNQNKLLKRQQISVNHPMVLAAPFDDITIYQASFAPTGKIRLKINGNEQTVLADQQFGERSVAEIPIQTASNQPLMLVVFPFYIQQDPGVTAHHIRAFLHTGKGFLGQKAGKMPDNINLRQGESGKLGPVSLEFIEPVFASGLMIKKAPELPWMFIAFALISLGVAMSLQPQRRLWLAIEMNPSQPGTMLYWLGKTRKAQITFNETLDSFQSQWLERLAGQVA